MGRYGRLRVLAITAMTVVLVACSGAGADDTGAAADDVVKGDTPERAEVKVLLAEVTFDPATLGAAESRRTITFYDTPSLELSKGGLILRSRDGQDGDDDVTVKLRPMGPSRVDASLHGESELKCELDVNAGAKGTSSCSWTEAIDGSLLKAASRDPARVGALWSKGALRFAALGGREIDGLALRPLGPIASTVWKLESEELGEEITFERWDVPGGDRTLEASIKIKTANVQRKQAELLAWLATHELTQAKVQKTKTAAALEALSASAR